MITQLHLSSHVERLEERHREFVTLPNLLFIAGLYLDLLARPIGPKNGHKRPASVEVRIGGTGANGASVGIVNAIPMGVVAVRAGGAPGDWCEDLASQRGLKWIPVARTGAAPALTLAVPNGGPGEFDLHVQRTPPPSVLEMQGVPDSAVHAAQASILGPMPKSPEAAALHAHIAGLSPYAAMMVHPSWLRLPAEFAVIASRYRYFQMNASEAVILDPRADHLAKLACRVRHLLNEAGAERTDFAITNAGDRGYVFADGRWLAIKPPKTVLRSDVGAGDAFCTGWVVARRFFNATADLALDYASRVATAHVSNKQPPRF